MSDAPHSARRVGLIVASAGLAAAAVWAALSSSTPPPSADGDGDPGELAPAAPARPAQRRADMPPAADAGDRATGCQFETGERLAYHLTQTTQSRIDPARMGLPADLANQTPHEITRSLQSDLELEVLQVDESGDALLLASYQQFRSPHISAVQRLETAFLFRVSPWCNITAFARKTAMPLALARVQQAVLHELLWRWPTDGSGAATDEGLGEGQDSLGSYVTAHALAEHEDGLLAQRRIRSYREYWKDERGQKSALFTTPEHAMLQVRVGSGAWFEALDGRTVIDGNGLHSDNRVSALSQEPTEGALDDASRDPGDYRFENLLPRHYPVRAPRAVSRLDHQARALVRDLTVEQSIAGYLQRVDDSAGYNDQWMPLMHYLEARPEATDDIVKSLKNGDIPEDAAPGVYVALGRTRTDEAKQALWDIMADDTAPEPERMRAMFNLIDRDDVDATLAQTLSDYTPLITSGSNPIERIHGREALLALGAMAGLHEDPEVHALAKGAIEAVLASSNEAMVVRPAFGAMANMADPAMLGTAERHALSTDEAMREAAAVVVRRLAPQDATDYVAERLADEASPKVRRALYRTMENQLADTPVAYGRAVVLEAVADLADQPGPMTRRAIINVLGHAASEHDEARIALMKQIPIELGKRSGLYDVIVSHLEPPDIQEALAYAE